MNNEWSIFHFSSAWQYVGFTLIPIPNTSMLVLADTDTDINTNTVIINFVISLPVFIVKVQDLSAWSLIISTSFLDLKKQFSLVILPY